jgi:hypothetical protein
MGVKHLWKALERGGTVETFDGADPAQHAAIMDELEGAAVAVDLSAWLVQATTQPALMEAYHSEYACVLKVVFERTVHWLRHGCLPIFVVEGAPPPAKLEKLRQRCVAVYGPAAANWRPGQGSVSGRFAALGRKATELLDALGVPWVQAEGEGEATCAALNVRVVWGGGWGQMVDNMNLMLRGRSLEGPYKHTAKPTNQPLSQQQQCRCAAGRRAATPPTSTRCSLAPSPSTARSACTRRRRDQRRWRAAARATSSACSTSSAAARRR